MAGDQGKPRTRAKSGQIGVTESCARNFPDEVIGADYEPPLTFGQERKAGRRSYKSDKDAAEACDHAAVQKHGKGVRRNFPGRDIPVPPPAIGEERQEDSSE
ncbi:hypothetical protein FOA52_003876 [Chlamydomonas sp. UWO 241]|nr:hypothetical protein FOA52_003876 [Chlamydomonas sp. UWO 241]